MKASFYFKSGVLISNVTGEHVAWLGETKFNLEEKFEHSIVSHHRISGSAHVLIVDEPTLFGSRIEDGDDEHGIRQAAGGLRPFCRLEVYDGSVCIGTHMEALLSMSLPTTIVTELYTPFDQTYARQTLQFESFIQHDVPITMEKKREPNFST